MKNPDALNEQPEEVVEEAPAREQSEARVVQPATSMEDLLKGLQTELDGKSGEDSLAEELRKKTEDLEKKEREGEIKALEEEARILGELKERTAGEIAYFALTGNVEGYVSASDRQMERQLEADENEERRNKLEAANIGRRKDHWLVSYTEYRANEKKRDQEELIRIKGEEPAERIRREQERLSEGKEIRGGLVLINREKVKSPKELVAVIAKEFAVRFDHNKGSRGMGLLNGMQMGHSMEGVGVTAMEAGDVGIAAQALSFMENVRELPPEMMARLSAAVGKLDPEKKRAFVEAMDIERKKPQRLYKQEDLTQSEKPIYSR